MERSANRVRAVRAHPLAWLLALVLWAPLGCQRKPISRVADAGVAVVAAVPGVDAGLATEELRVTGPPIRDAQHCTPRDALVAPHRSGGRARLVVRGRGFDYDVADAPLVCGLLHTPSFPKKARGPARAGTGTLFSTCAGALVLRLVSLGEARGAARIQSAAMPAAADEPRRVDVTLSVGPRTYEIDSAAPATLEIDATGRGAKLRARMRRVDNPIEKIEVALEGRCDG